MDDLIAFVNARLDEDERQALATAPSGKRLAWKRDVLTDDDGRIVGHAVVSHGDVAGVAHALGVERGTGVAVAAHIARHDPARVLREVAAKRKIIADYEGTRKITGDDDEYVAGLAAALYAIAAIWSDHPDYRAEWRL